METIIITALLVAAWIANTGLLVRWSRRNSREAYERGWSDGYDKGRENGILEERDPAVYRPIWYTTKATARTNQGTMD